MADSYNISKAMEDTSCLKANGHTLYSSMVSKQEDCEEIRLWQDCQEAVARSIGEKQGDPPSGTHQPVQVRCYASVNVEQEEGGSSLTG